MLRLFCLSWIAGIALIGSTSASLDMFQSIYWLGLGIISLSCLLSMWYRDVLYKYLILKYCLIGLACVCLFATGWKFADQQLMVRLANEVKQRQTVEGVVYIDSLSEGKIDNWRQKAQLLIPTENKTINVLLYPKRVYDVEGEFSGWTTDHFELGQFYQVTVEIKPPHGYVNVGGFDQEKWLLQENIQATATVLFSQKLSQQSIVQQGWYLFVRAQQRLLPRWCLWIEHLRLEYREQLLKSNQQSDALLLGLLTGDRSGIDKDTIQRYQYMGISHLLAISGPHVLILATLLTALLMHIIHRCMRRGKLGKLYLYCPKQRLYLPCFMLMVTFYVAFTGFEIPALRTWMMALICSICLWMQWKISALTLLLTTACIVLYVDCFAVLSAAFWLSFCASAILLMIYQNMQQQEHQDRMPWLERIKNTLHLLWQSQWRIFIALMPIVLWQFKAVSMISPVVNFFAIPFLSLVIVPLDILAALLWQLIPVLGEGLWWLGSAFISVFNVVLGTFADLAQWLYIPSSFTLLQLLSLSIALWIISLPVGLVHRVWVIPFILPIFLQAKQPILQLDILDVGQGQAIVLRTQQHHMLIDAGGGSGQDGQMTMGDRVVLPFLRSQGIKTLDEILLTHLDLDHRGGAQAILDHLAVKQLRSNQHDQSKLPVSDVPFVKCNQGQVWQADQVKLEILWPLARDQRKDANESSCVVLAQVSMGQQNLNILLMGDAGWETEYYLLQYYPHLKVDILVLGHHGSRHSSAYDFLKQLEPDLAISSAGIDNRYGHPTAEVKARLADLNIPHLNTMSTGRIHIALQQENAFWQIEYDRQAKKWLLP